jgi:tRNA threonylcarbamoyladenosine biosynthesis protein TsaE
MSSGVFSEARRETHDANETRAIGVRLGQAARPGDVLLLLGQFGAGKTTLVQGIARGLGIDGPVTSPSFVIANEHQGRIPLYHVDLYRVEEMDRATLEALSEYFESDGICAVEWPDALPTDLVEHAVRVALRVVDEDTRELVVTASEGHPLLEAFGGGVK